MYCISKIDLIDKYSPERFVKKKKYKYTKSVQVVETYYEKEIQYYCKVGDKLEIMSSKIDPCFVVLIAMNSKGKRFSIRYENVEIKYPSLDDDI